MATRKKRSTPRAPDRYLTHAERMAVRTSKRWVAGYAELVAQWHPTRNIDLYPYEVTHASPRAIWWKCDRGADHEWRASPAHRTDKRRPQGCPFCAGKRVSVTNSLATRAPTVAAEWHPRRNGALTAAQVTAGTWRKIWWRCSLGHVWRAPVVKRVAAGTGCPKCAGNVVSSLNSLSRNYPQVAREWHPNKNGSLRRSRVSYGSKKAVWWLCPRDKRHEYRAPPNRRTANGAGCPFCSGNAVDATNSLLGKRPEIAHEWHPTRNGKMSAADVTSVSQKTVWWKCSMKPRHVWSARVCDRTAMGRGCPKCAEQRRAKRRASSEALSRAMQPAKRRPQRRSLTRGRRRPRRRR